MSLKFKQWQMHLQPPTVLFSIYQNNDWIIRPLVDEKIDPVTQCIILKIVRFLATQSFGASQKSALLTFCL